MRLVILQRLRTRPK